MNNLTVVQLIVFFLLVFGGFMRASVRPRLPKVSKESLERLAEGKKHKRPETAREYVDRINGKTRENLFSRSRREARQVYSPTGQIHAYN